MINQSTKYTIEIAEVAEIWENDYMQHCIVIKDENTGEHLTSEQYAEWIMFIGGHPK